MTTPVSSPTAITLPVSPSTTSFTYNAMSGTAISDNLIESCAQLFSTNYGKWGESADTISRFTKPGQSYLLCIFAITELFFRTIGQDDWQ